VLYIPEGRYVITQQLLIQKALILQGAGSSRTTLLFPRSLAQATRNYEPMAFSFFNAFIYFLGSRTTAHDGNLLGKVKSGSKRGATTVQVQLNKGVNLRKGDWVVISLLPPTPGKRFISMNQYTTPGCASDPHDKEAYCQKPRPAFNHPTRVVELSGKRLVIERPLPWKLHRDMPAQLHKWDPVLSDAGIEGVRIEFDDELYPGHFKEEGNNAVEIKNAANCFVRDVHVVNAERGITIWSSMFVTVTQVTLSASGRRGEQDKTGHHGLTIKDSSDCLIHKFELKTKFFHDITVDRFAFGNVFSSGKGVDVNLDMHRGQNYGNLFTDLDLGKGTRAFSSGGKADRGPHAGSFTTYWRVYRSGPKDASRMEIWKKFGPALNFVGSSSVLRMPGLKESKMRQTWHIEDIDPQKLQPANLYVAMKKRRLQKK